jgi:hypothetical protein
MPVGRGTLVGLVAVVLLAVGTGCGAATLVREVGASTADHDSGGITTNAAIAGNGSEGYCGDSGPAPGATLYHTQGAASDSSGDLGAADKGDNRIDGVGTFAFNTHLYARESNLDLRAFKANVDELAGLGIDRLAWIRFAIDDVDAFPRTDNDTHLIDCSPASPTNCNPANLAVYDEAIDYARSKGFGVFLVTNVPSWAKVYSAPVNPWEARYSLEEYKQITTAYYRVLASRYAGKVAIWQVFNEANVLTFDAYAKFTLNDSYLRMLSETIAQARETIRSVDPGASITTNAGGWPYDASLHAQWKRYFDALHTNLEVVSLDVYPDKDRSAIDSLVSRVEEIRSRYSKPVAIAETGLCTDAARFTEADQAAYLPMYIEGFREAGASIIAIYELQDNTELSGACEQSFGLRTADGDKKASYDAVMARLCT